MLWPHRLALETCYKGKRDLLIWIPIYETCLMDFWLYKICWKCQDNDERPTGKKNTTIEWEDGEKDNSNLILTEVFPLAHETWYIKVLSDNNHYFLNATLVLRLTNRRVFLTVLVATFLTF